MSRPWIEAIESALGAEIPNELRALYERGDGEDFASAEGRPMRLLKADEAIAANRELSAMGDLRGSSPIWISDNGDYATLFLKRPLQGRVRLGECSVSMFSDPVSYRSISSFLESMNEAAPERGDWYEMPTDYLVGTSYYTHGAGVCKPVTADDVESDRAAFRAMVAGYEAGDFEAEGDELFYAANAIALAPPDETASIVRFLDSQDMYAQETACRALGHRRYEPAVPRLAALAREPGGNGQTAAVTALGKIGSDAARDAILASVGGFSDGLDLLLVQALEATGCQTRFDEDKRRKRTYYYRANDAATWNPLR